MFKIFNIEIPLFNSNIDSNKFNHKFNYNFRENNLKQINKIKMNNIYSCNDNDKCNSRLVPSAIRFL